MTTIKRANQKAARLIGPLGVARRYGSRKFPRQIGKMKYVVGVLQVGGVKELGSSSRSFREAFENAGLYEETPKRSRV